MDVRQKNISCLCTFKYMYNRSLLVCLLRKPVSSFKREIKLNLEKGMSRWIDQQIFEQDQYKTAKNNYTRWCTMCCTIHTHKKYQVFSWESLTKGNPCGQFTRSFCFKIQYCIIGLEITPTGSKYSHRASGLKMYGKPKPSSNIHMTLKGIVAPRFFIYSYLWDDKLGMLDFLTLVDNRMR
jgi:hypothetical protein